MYKPMDWLFNRGVHRKVCARGKDLQDVAQHLIVTPLRDATHRSVDCFDHQHPVLLIVQRELLLLRLLAIILFIHLVHLFTYAQ